jgi:hypothetical protein
MVFQPLETAVVLDNPLYDDNLRTEKVLGVGYYTTISH